MIEEQIRKRMSELAKRAYINNYYTYTNFLGLAEINILKAASQTDDDIRMAGISLYGGTAGCERVVAAFGKPEIMGYEPQFPIKCIEVKPLNIKYADKLTHRDYLGSILNLGIEREVTGDIIVRGDSGYVFCLENMADYIVSGLVRIKHTSVACRITDDIPDIMSSAVNMCVQVPSERIDACVARVFKMSRADAAAVIKGRKVYVNGMLCVSNSYVPRPDDMVSVRGCGRFRYIGIKKSTQKGNYIVEILIFS